MSAPGQYHIRVAETAEDFQAFARLALEYQQWLGVSLCFQAFDKELSSLPGCYSPPGGFILLASCTNRPEPGPEDGSTAQDVACVGVRPLHTNSTASTANFGPAPQHTSKATFSSASPAIADGSCNTTIISTGCQPGAACRNTHASGVTAAAAAGDVCSSSPDDVIDVSMACEMKRLWVQSEHQKQGLGRELVSAAMDRARQAGHKHMVLDTLESLAGANQLYSSMGFKRRSSYYHNPLPGVVYWQADL